MYTEEELDIIIENYKKAKNQPYVEPILWVSPDFYKRILKIIEDEK
jgi:hypothetical protein